MSDGNGAREKVIQYFDKIIFEDAGPSLSADHFLIWLAAEGYVIVPLETANKETVK